MSDGNSAMAASQGMQAVGSLASGYSQSKALKAQGDYQKSIYDMNAKFAQFEADDAIDRGKTAATEYKKKGKALIGSQRAALAAQGIEVDSGSAAEVQADTRIQIEKETINIKNNAWREAWGYKTQALQSSYSGEIAKAMSITNANNTLLTGGMNASTSGMKAYAYMNMNQSPDTTKKGSASPIIYDT